METVTRLFAGLMLAAAFASSAAAADRPIAMTGINHRLDGVIQAQMARQLREHKPVSQVPQEPATKGRVFENDAPDAATDPCPCYEYVYRRAPQKPAL